MRLKAGLDFYGISGEKSPSRDNSVVEFLTVALLNAKSNQKVGCAIHPREILY